MTQEAVTKRAPRFTFPTAYTILFVLIIVVAIGTWIIPAGQYERVESAELERDVPLPGTYQQVDRNPQGFVDVLIAPIAGFYDPDSYIANAIDVALFVLVIGGFLGVVAKTGAINVGIARVMVLMKGHEKWMIPVLMALFAAGGTTYGMAEESLAFYALLIPVVLAVRYDAVVAVAIILIGAGIGVLGSTINPFATVIASDAAGISFTDGIWWRVFILVAGWLISVVFVMRYAAKVQNTPSDSVVADRSEEIEAAFRREPTPESETLTLTHKIVLAIFAITFAAMIWGVSSQGWWMETMSALFLGSAILIGIVARLGERGFTDAFVDGARDLLGVALVIGIARGIVVIMDAGMITDTILNAGENVLEGAAPVVFISTMFGIESLLSFLVPSSSGLAVLSMPIMAPLADFVDVQRSLVVTAYQSASGLVNLINPTFAVVMGGLAIARVPYERWIKFIWPLMLILAALIVATLSVAVLVS